MIPGDRSSAETSPQKAIRRDRGGTMLELYHAPTSTCSQKVRLCLAEKGLDWIDRRLNLAAEEHLTPEYLDEVFPTPGLTPSDPVERAAMRAWLRFLEEVPTAAIRVPSFHQVLARRYEALDEDTFVEKVADVRPLRKNFYRRMGRHGFSAGEVAESLDELAHALDRMEDALRKGPWLMGAQFTLADIVATPTIDRMDDLGHADMWARRPNVAAWYERIRARPSFPTAYMKGSRLSERDTVRPLEAAALAGRQD